MDLLQTLSQLFNAVPYGDTIYTALVFIVVLSILVFVHEMGHFLAARSVGVRVNEFAVGFGREIWGRTDKRGTRWKICWLPLGGYVQLFGQDDLRAVKLSKTKQKESFAHKTVLQRAWVIVAGPLANFVFALVVLAGLMMVGEQRLSPVIGEVLPETPAAAAGLQPGDRVQAIDGAPVGDWDDMRERISARAGETLMLTLLRPQAAEPAHQEAAEQVQQPATAPVFNEVRLPLTPELQTITDVFGDEHQVGRIGISPSYETFTVYHGPLQALAEAGQKTWELTALTVTSIWKLITGALSTDQLSGPLGIANMAGNTAAEGGIYALFMFMVLISVNLAVLNLLPVPVLDGGHLLFLAYEAVFGRPPGERAQNWGLRFGLMFIVMLVCLSTFNDVMRLESVQTLLEDDAQPAQSN